MSSFTTDTPITLITERSSNEHYASVTVPSATFNSSTVIVHFSIRGSLLNRNIASSIEAFKLGSKKITKFFPDKAIKARLILDQIESFQDEDAMPELRTFIRTLKKETLKKGQLHDLSESLTVTSSQPPILHALVFALGPHTFSQRSIHVELLPDENGNFASDSSSSGASSSSLFSVFRKSATLDVLSIEHHGKVSFATLRECHHVMCDMNSRQDLPLRELCLKGLTLSSKANENPEEELSKLITICKNLDKIVLDDIQVQDSTGSKRQMSFQYLGQAISSLKKLQVLEVSRLDLEQGCVEEMDAFTLPEMGGWRQFMASSTLQDSLRSLSMINCNISDIVTVSTLLHHKDGQRFPKLSKLDVSDNELVMVMHILSLRKAYGDEVVITDREVADFAASEEVEEEKKQDEDEDDDDDVELLADTFDCTQMY